MLTWIERRGTGNLGHVEAISEIEYDLAIRPDTNNSRYVQRTPAYFTHHPHPVQRRSHRCPSDTSASILIDG